MSGARRGIEELERVRDQTAQTNNWKGLMKIERNKVNKGRRGRK